MELIPLEEELELIQRAKQGDEEAWRRLVEVFMQPLCSFLYHYLGNMEDARDAAQDAFVRAIANLDGFKESRRFSTWLFTIAANRAKDILKSAANRRSYTVAELSDNLERQDERRVLPPDEETIEKEMMQDLQRAIGELPEKMRAAFSLYYFEDMGMAEIAKILRSSHGAIKVQISRAREYIARRYPQLNDYLKR
ncbi:MAG: sigma-70 family RNA polymerase sigma factor [Leptospiraceae bacterium]|nr:sigma-70 family RNA polymerase sigma factor [Leptospiraceae bacterium]MDW8305933.1 sigma-70 family RNA polymerase sigma factor [Leptospiraceae bacterium]